MRYWKTPVVYASRDTARELWALLYGQPLSDDHMLDVLRIGQSRMPLYYDDTLPLGEVHIEEDPLTPLHERPEGRGVDTLVLAPRVRGVVTPDTLPTGPVPLPDDDRPVDA